MPKTKTKPRKKAAAPRAPAAAPTEAQVHELLLQALETEIGGVSVYETAIECARNPELREEWEKYLEQTKKHVQVVEELCRKAGCDPEQETPGREIVRGIGEALVGAMEEAQQAGDPAAAEMVAAECVTLAETKDHHNWELIGELAKATRSDLAKDLAKAHEKVEEEEDEHLYHSQGWARELWIKALGLPSVLPPPEEKHDVHTASAAEKAKKQRAKEAKLEEAEEE